MNNQFEKTKEFGKVLEITVDIVIIILARATQLATVNEENRESMIACADKVP